VLFGFLIFFIANNTIINEYEVFYYNAPVLINENPLIELECKDQMNRDFYEGFWVVENGRKRHLSAKIQSSNKLTCVLDEANNIDDGQQITIYINIGEKTLLEKFIDNIRGVK
jgi:hypothetical protein